MNEIINQILQGDCLEVLKSIADKSINCCITSPPYYGLRDYGTGTWEGGDPECDHLIGVKRQTMHQNYKDTKGDGTESIAYKKVCAKCGAVRVDKQIGLEETPKQYIDKLVQVFREVRRVLKDDGTLWLNIGDSYASSANDSEIKPKDMIGIPWMLAFALRADGWYLRQDIIWHKPNPMPESVKDRCTKSHEYIFLMSKSPSYYFDAEAIQEPMKEESEARYKSPFFGGKQQRVQYGNENAKANTEGFKEYTGMRNKRDVWSVGVSHLRDEHFATYPEKLVETCILAGCPKGGIVLDPFFGSGTTGRVAIGLDRNYLGIELNPEYIEIANRRTDGVQTTLFC